MLPLFFSSTARRTLTSTMVTYAVTLAILLGIPVIASYVLPFVSIIALVGTNTSAAFEAFLLLLGGLLICLNPFATAVATEIMLLEENTPFYYIQYLSGGASVPVPSPWIVHTILYLAISALFISLSVRSAGRPER